ncbi:winged helix-turn-helix transcriptional regulator [Acetobacterium bakii]|uniref:HTH hxlR-type domain-containing protein n=1 Tax=Acetobacterium bakii TaxID=52689 RepID=A0A0L6TZZ9_9FIRM|nr:helix-turn-helix domain-containing protein [Acetobacterium bakii]KNZ41823.1 hypothetical protein AKG39_09350 [Acetobacterium bakii]
MEEKAKFYCALDYSMNLIGGKWKLLILHQLSGGTKRFSELKRLLPGITPKMLTSQLRELEKNGIITRKIYPEVPPRVEYTMTRHGMEIIPVLSALCDWARGVATEKGIQFSDE